MVLPYDDNICAGHENSGLNGKSIYRQNSSGLFLNATSIISVTCSRNKQELEKATRLTGVESPTKSRVQVPNLSDSLELCPSVWFDSPEAASSRRKCAKCIWKLCFFCVCLPMCYPCYISRVLRYLVLRIISD